MISVSIIWMYMAATCFATGYAALTFLTGKTEYRIRYRISYLYAGVVFATVYAQIFSLFGKVGMLANGLLVVIWLGCLVFCRKKLRCEFSLWFEESRKRAILCLKESRQHSAFKGRTVILKILLYVLLVLLFAYGTSTGYQHYDTGLYHAQSIRWIEEYGIVKGLGNLHSRLAYNSSAFPLTALYSFKWLTGQSFHVCSGFLALLLVMTCAERIWTIGKQKLVLSDLIRVLALYYILNIFDEMISPASDYFMVLTVFYLLIRWLEAIETKETSYVPYGLLCVLGVFVVTVKFSGALVLLLTIMPAVWMIREKAWREILKYIGAGILVIAPFLIRNVILSGWLLYPFTGIDLFSLPFQIPKGMAEYDAREIQVFGRGFTDVASFDTPFAEWFPRWARALSGTDKVFLLAAGLGMLLFLTLLLVGVKKKKADWFPPLFVMGVFGICLLFWLFTAPLIRYGCIFLWTFPMLVWGFVYQQLTSKVDKYRLLYALLILLACYKAWNFGKETAATFTTEFLVLQKDYESFEVIPYELHGVTFYYPAEGDRTGYATFPSSPVKAEDIFIGDTIVDGFRDVIH